MKKDDWLMALELTLSGIVLLVLVSALTGCAGSPKKPINSLGNPIVPQACLETPKAILEPSRGIVDEYIDLVVQYTDLAILKNQCREFLLNGE